MRVNGKVPDVYRLIEQFDGGSQISVQSVSSQHGLVHLNSHLAAISFLLAGCLLCPVNSLVIAPRKMGKSTLIKVA